MSPLGRQRPRPGAKALAATCVALLTAACGGSADDPATDPDTAAVVPETTVTAVAPAGAEAGCPEWGLWQVCSVERRLERAGLRIERGEDVVGHDFLEVEGTVWKTARAEVQVFLYPSVAARANDLADMDTVAVQPHNRRIIWPQPASLVTSGNLTAIIISLNGREAERIGLALGAGLPARGPG